MIAPQAVTPGSDNDYASFAILRNKKLKNFCI